MVNCSFRVAFRAPREQQVYRPEMVVATMALELAKEGDSIAFDNQGATKAIPHSPGRVVPNQDFQGIGYTKMVRKNLSMHLVPGHKA